ncbi:hypothetical protein [Actibacterium sp. XHP0104]|uniref:hypothetical protein n=1 Tax=Actibacterium sp. XHP0104 TaxID=2984335 RepID=UPI0021E86384|nr:hypothetical protein [Actibacterium sp. XHP0104]MCV2880966.1 hypothetical protein [Actibacterium sp. XHP0104]
MNAQSDFSNFGASGAKSSGPWVSLCETNWGYIIRSDTQWSNRAALIERVCAAAGLACLTAAALQWLFPPAAAGVSMDSTEFRIMSSMGMAMPALMFLWISDRGMGQEIHVDIHKGELRQGVVNRKGKFRPQRVVPFADVASAYIKRVEGAGDLSQLFVRMRDGKKVLHLASGRENTLRLLHQRLINEMKPSEAASDGWELVGRRLLPAGRTA